MAIKREIRYHSCYSLLVQYILDLNLAGSKIGMASLLLQAWGDASHFKDRSGQPLVRRLLDTEEKWGKNREMEFDTKEGICRTRNCYMEQIYVRQDYNGRFRYICKIRNFISATM